MLMGVSLSAATVSSILAGCEVDPSDDWTPSFFTEDEAAFISELAETMLPRTNTPGAKDALVDRYLDTIRPLRYTAEDNQKYKEELQSFMAITKNEIGISFVRADDAKRLEWLTAHDKASYDLIKATPDMSAGERPFYLKLKADILGGYFNAEIVAKEFFAFDPIPGRYDACIPYDEVGKAWAL